MAGFPQVCCKDRAVSVRWQSRSAEQTEQLGEQLGRMLRPGDVITLEAPLGGGKTTLVRGLARGLGIDESAVSSPTFVIWNIYSGRLRLHHLDAYRLRSPDELEEIGFVEALDQGDVVVLEWPGVAAPLLPKHRLELSLDYGQGPEDRVLEMRGWDDRLTELCLESR